MQLENEFRVAADVDTTFDTMIDLEKVAPCMPGATLDEVKGDQYLGKMNVRLGPIRVVYQMVAELTHVDREAHSATILASGSEAKGSGTVRAEIVGRLREDGEGTLVTVVTNLNVTGKPAQFGRGVLNEVGAKTMAQFAGRLEDLIDADQAPEPADAPVPDEGRTAESPTSTAPVPRHQPPDTAGRRDDDALDLMSVAGGAAAKRLLPLLLAIVVVLIVLGVLIW